MKQRFTRTRIKGIVLRGGFVALMVGLIAFSVYQLAQHMTTGAQTLRTQTITDRTYAQMELYLFRDEVVLTSDTEGGLFVYPLGDGAKVGVGDTLAQTYLADPETTDLRAAQALLNSYSARIALLQRHSGVSNQTDVENALLDIDRQYMGVLSAMDDGRLGVADGFADKLMDALNRYRALTGQQSSTADALTLLQAEQSALIGQCPRGTDVLTDTSGYFYYELDGYEAMFPYEQVLTMTSAEFLEMTRSTAAEAASGTVVGKLVRQPMWYAATYLTFDEAAMFEVGDRCAVTCRNSAETQISMTVCRMESDENGVLVVFRTLDMPEGFSYDRRLSVQMIADEISGYRVPAGAVLTKTGENGLPETGVYILVGNTVEFRRVIQKRVCDGYLIVQTYSEVTSYLDGIGEQVGIGRYLNLNDLVLLNPSAYTEGEMLE